MENNTPAQSQNPNETMHHGDVNFNTTDQTTQPPAPRRSFVSTIINIIIIIFIGVIVWGGVTYYNNNIKNKDGEPSPTPVISDEEAGQDGDVKGDENDNEEESSEEQKPADVSGTATNGKAKGGDVLGTTTVVSVKADINDPNNWDIVRVTSHGITFKHPKMNYTCCGIQGPLTGNPGEVIVLANTSTITEGTNKPFDGMAMYMIFKDEGISLNDYLNTEKEELLKKYEEVKGVRGENAREEDVNLSGKSGKLLKGYAYWGDVYYLQLDDKHILYITKTDESDGSFNDTFKKILETLQFAY